MHTTKIVGIIGNPLSHSLSPQIHNACFEKLSMNWNYVPFEIDMNVLGNLIFFAKKSNVAGFNVTMPYKESVIEYLDEMSPESAMIGAVNTIKIDNGKAIGFNTDAYAINKVICDDQGKTLKDKKVLIIGAGGVAKAAAYSVINLGCRELKIANRSVEHGKGLAQSFDGYSCRVTHFGLDRLTNEAKSTDIIINATPVGMFPCLNKVPLDVELLHKEQYVLDLIYHPADTELVHGAREKGLRATGGVPVFIYQAAESFKIWTGVEPPVEVMARVIEEKFKER